MMSNEEDVGVASVNQLEVGMFRDVGVLGLECLVRHVSPDVLQNWDSLARDQSRLTLQHYVVMHGDDVANVRSTHRRPSLPGGSLQLNA